MFPPRPRSTSASLRPTGPWLRFSSPWLRLGCCALTLATTATAARPQAIGRGTPAPSVAPRALTSAAIGEADSDLLFVPLAPCRVLDTRLMAAGDLAAGETRGFVVAGGSGFAAQGGAAGGCGVPLGLSVPIAPMVAINLVAVGPEGPGHLQAWEFGQPEPAASAINYSNFPGLNIANGLLVPIAGVNSAAADLAIRANVSATHVVADVSGYFTRLPVEAVRPTLSQGGTSLFPLSSGACVALTSCTVTTTGAAGKVLVQGEVYAAIEHTAGTRDALHMSVEAGAATCPDFTPSGRVGHEISSAHPTSPDNIRVTLANHEVLEQGPGTTVSYHLGARMAAGASASDAILEASISCLFVPD